MFEYLVPSWWRVWEARGMALLEESVTGAGSEVSKTHNTPRQLCVSCLWIRMLALGYCASTMPACLPNAVLLARMVMSSNPLEL